MSFGLRITIEDERGLRVSQEYDANERAKAMDRWDKLLDDAIPGERCRLINRDNDRIVSEYHNMRVEK